MNFGEIDITNDKGKAAFRAECKMKMLIKKCLAKLFQPLIVAINDSRDSLVAENQKLRLEMLGILRDAQMKISCLAAKSLPAKEASGVSSIQETEFRVFSQFGEDGIIQFLISNIEIPNKTFVEFGVEDYAESNTRFLLINNNWSGLVIDGSQPNVESIKNDAIYWKHDLTALNAFITKDNINRLIASRFSGDMGLLSIDIDGNDYWIWDSINVVNPRIVICEYNSVFGNKHCVTIPYSADFVRHNAHCSNLYFGASLGALSMLAERRGYFFVGCNSAGNNAFFVRKDVIGNLPVVSLEEGYVASKFRESRDEQNMLTFVSGENRIKLIGAMSVIDLKSGQTVKLSSL